MPDFSPELATRVLQIIMIDLVLSGDNAVVIGMAARPLPHRQRRLAIVIGGGAAILLRVALTTVAVLLLMLPALQAVGGIVLLWIAVRLLEPSSYQNELSRSPTTLGGAIGTILLADLVMSLDNVLGVAAAAKGDVPLLIFALVVSMAFLMLAGGLVANLLDRFWWLAYVGAAVIAWTGAEMLQEDSLIQQWLDTPDLMRWIIDGLVVVAVILVARRIHHQPPRPEPVTARSERISE